MTLFELLNELQRMRSRVNDQIEFGLQIEKRCADWREFKIQRQLKRIESDAHIGTQD